MEEKKMTKEESLELITRMIQVTRGNVRSGSIYFMLWGWVAVTGTVGQFVLHTQFGYRHPYVIWLIGIPAMIFTFWHASKKSKSSGVRTFSDGVLMKTWIGYLICMAVLIISAGYINYRVTSMIMMFLGFATFISGIVINFKPLYLGGILFWILTPVAFYVGVIYSPLVMTVAIIIGYLIPGYILKSRE